MEKKRLEHAVETFKNKFESATVNEPPVFESLKFYYISRTKTFVDIIHVSLIIVPKDQIISLIALKQKL